MRKSGLTVLLLVCFLISLPVAASDHESVEAESLMNFLQTPEITLISFPEEITTNERGELAVLLLADSEIVIHDVINFDIPLLEFPVYSDGCHKLYGSKVLELGKAEFILTLFGNPFPMWLGGADLFCLIQQSDLQI